MMHYRNVRDWKEAVQQRYEGECGRQAAALLGGLYTNWHLPRINTQTGIGGVKARFENGPLQEIMAVDKIVSDFREGLQTSTMTLRDTISKMVDPRNGVLASGTNCKVIGQTVLSAKEAVCTRLFNSVYVMAVASFVTAFWLFFVLCLLYRASVNHEHQYGYGIKDEASSCCQDPYRHPLLQEWKIQPNPTILQNNNISNVANIQPTLQTP